MSKKLVLCLLLLPLSANAGGSTIGSDTVDVPEVAADAQISPEVAVSLGAVAQSMSATLTASLSTAVQAGPGTPEAQAAVSAVIASVLSSNAPIPPITEVQAAEVNALIATLLSSASTDQERAVLNKLRADVNAAIES